LYGIHVRGFAAAAAAAAALQAVARRVAYQTFSHVLELDITFHMNRRTGRLSRILERGEQQQQQQQLQNGLTPLLVCAAAAAVASWQHWSRLAGS
jgi:ABC-type transport system involved in Fe-S cluster assembly fused permease/ATPase subunit